MLLGPRRRAPATEAAGAIAGWRFERLLDAGLSTELARRVALDGAYDLHELLELIDRGCPTDLAVRILAPMPGSGERR